MIQAREKKNVAEFSIGGYATVSDRKNSLMGPLLYHSKHRSRRANDIRLINPSHISGAFKGRSGLDRCIFGKVYGVTLHSLQLWSRCCIQLIVGLHPRLDLNNPNARLNDLFILSCPKARFHQHFELAPCWKSQNSKCQ